MSRRTAAWLAAVMSSGIVASPGASAAHFVIVNGDGASEGLNDPTPVAPAGGNTATTRGAARLAALQFAANAWGQLLDSSVDIKIGATFDALTCTPTSAVLGSAGPTTIHRDFTSAPLPGVWYPQAPANALAQVDLDPASNDISAHFNSTLDGGTCLGGNKWYYGFDGLPPAGLVDYVTVALHELAHGLGFITFVDLTTGAKAMGRDDAFMLQLEQHGVSPATYPQMADAQRVVASESDPQLHWIGLGLDDAAGAVLSMGTGAGHVRMYGPAAQAPGSSVSHFSTALAPDELMEPFFTGANHNLTLTADLLYDAGWRAPTLVAVPGLPVGARAVLALLLALVGGGLLARRRTLTARWPAEARARGRWGRSSS